MNRILAPLLLTLALPATALAVPPLSTDGVWAGADERGRLVSLHVKGSNVVVVDADHVIIGGLRRGAIVSRVVAATLTDGRGRVLTLSKDPAGRDLDIAVTKETACIQGRGLGKLLGATPKRARCVTLQRLTGGLDACVAQCVRSQQMRAVGPDAIEADCRRSCGDR